MVYALRSYSIARHGLLLATPPLLGAARLIAAARRKAVVRVCFDRELGLQLRNKTPKRRVKAKLREDRRPATRSNETWAMDFVHDQLVTGRKLRVLIIVDAFSRFSRRWNRVSHSVALMLWRYSISSFALISYAQVKRFSRWVRGQLWQRGWLSSLTQRDWHFLRLRELIDQFAVVSRL
jgi:hypothetical protein